MSEQGSVTIARRDHRAILKALETIEQKHTRRRDVDGRIYEPPFPHDPETHEDAVRDCPQCDVLEAVFRLRALLTPVQEATGKKPELEVITITQEMVDAREAQLAAERTHGDE